MNQCLKQKLAHIRLWINICQMSVECKYLNTKSYWSPFTVLLAHLMFLISIACHYLVSAHLCLFLYFSLFFKFILHTCWLPLIFKQFHYFLISIKNISLYIKIKFYNFQSDVCFCIIKLTWTHHLPTQKYLVVLCILEVFHMF